MRTVGRKIRPGERRRYQCDYCSALFDQRDLRRDASGLWVCPQEGPGRDAVTLTKGNAEALRSHVARVRTYPEQAGQYGDKAVTALAAVTGNILAEDGTPLTTEDGVYLLQEAR